MEWNRTKDQNNKEQRPTLKKKNKNSFTLTKRQNANMNPINCWIPKPVLNKRSTKQDIWWLSFISQRNGRKWSVPGHKTVWKNNTNTLSYKKVSNYKVRKSSICFNLSSTAVKRLPKLQKSKEPRVRQNWERDKLLSVSY